MSKSLNHHTQITILAAFLFLAATNMVYAADYYVSTTGSDTNGGLSQDEAWRTIQYAANMANAGDTIHVLSGTYTEQVVISRSGTANNPIILEGEGKPTITRTGNWYTDGPVVITGSYITIRGFNIIAYDTVYDIENGGLVAGIRVAYNSGATNLNISNNYIWTQSGYGVLFHENAGSGSLISNNEIHTGHQAGIVLSSPYTEQWNIEISRNTIYVDENKQHRDYTDASGIWTSYETARNLNISYNKILHSGYTAIKIGGIGHKINYNEIGPDGFVHNGIEITSSETEYMGNYIHDTNLNWVTQTNTMYSAGTSYEYNNTIKDNIIENSVGRAITIGGHQSDFLIENNTISNFNGVGIEILGFDSPIYPSTKVTSDDMMFINVNMDLSSTAYYPITIISLGTKLTNNTFARDDITFINPKITGLYTLATWFLTNIISNFDINWHFDGTVYAINSNKNDVVMTRTADGTFNGEIIFYYYADVQVVDTDGNPVDGAKVSFTTSDPAIKAKNLNYTYEPFVGKTQDIDFTYTRADGHIPLPSNVSETVAIADFKQAITGKDYYTWTITAEKNGYNSSTTVIPDASWYREDPNTYQNTVTIVLPMTITQAIDLNGDGAINILDIVIVAQHFGESTTCPTACPAPNYDIDSNGSVDILDIRLVAEGM